MRGFWDQCIVLGNDGVAAPKDKQPHPANSKYLRWTISFAIVFNAVMIGLEVDVAKSERLDDTIVFVIFECLCLGLFIVEMVGGFSNVHV